MEHGVWSWRIGCTVQLQKPPNNTLVPVSNVPPANLLYQNQLHQAALIDWEMASSLGPNPITVPPAEIPSPPSPLSLASSLSAALPAGSPPFHIHYISHPPTRCDPLYSAPHGKKPERTTLTSRFLALSSSTSGILVYAIEIHIYATRTRTTIFVSKADSTGFFPKSATPATKGSISPVRAITTAFLRYLLDTTKRNGATQHLTLFARAQDQYLFPNSVRNKGKHVLSDIQLIRWWAKVLDPIVSSYTVELGSPAPDGYILVPGLDRVDLRNVFPNSKWIHGHPYSDPEKPVRECIPNFEDDPKARFMGELEEQGWKGVRSMKEFWELMAFRQECSLGKSVGFLSVIIQSSLSHKTSENDSQNTQLERGESQNSQTSTRSSSRPGARKRRPSESDSGDGVSKKDKTKLPLSSNEVSSASTYTIASLLRNPETRGIICRRASTLSRSQSYASTASGTDGTDGKQTSGRILSKKDYDRLMASLLDSDFEGKKCASESSILWTKMAGGEALPQPEASKHVVPQTGDDKIKVNILTVRKRKSEESIGTREVQIQTADSQAAVNVLQPRKRTKPAETNSGSPVVNVLQPRKKEKEEPASESASASINVLQPRKKAKDSQ